MIPFIFNWNNWNWNLLSQALHTFSSLLAVFSLMPFGNTINA